MTDVSGDGSAPAQHDDAGVTVVASLEEVDAEVRAKLTGHSVASIAEQAERAFATINVQLTGEQLTAYSDAVSTGAPFSIDTDQGPHPHG